MIIWFDSFLTMHLDKSSSADNSFALAKYVPKGYQESDVYFKANAVVSSNVLLLTHQQVTRWAGKLYHGMYSSSTTIRNHFFADYLKNIEEAIARHLRGTKGYKGNIFLRLRVGSSTVCNFDYRGYRYFKDSDEQRSCYNDEVWARFVILQKEL